MVSGNQQPDHWTLSEFRRRHLGGLKGLFLQTVKLAQQAGLVKLGQVAIDGTKLQASASKHRAMSYGRMVKEEQRLRDEIARYFEEVETTDQAEDERYGAKRGDELPDHLKTEAQRLEAIREAMARLEEEARQKAKAEQEKRREKANKEGHGYRPRKDPNDAVPSPKAQHNFTDPDSRIMKNADKAFIQGYNGQIAVDVDSQIIVAAQLSNQAADGPHLPFSAVKACRSSCERTPRCRENGRWPLNGPGPDSCRGMPVRSELGSPSQLPSVWQCQALPGMSVLGTAYLELASGPSPEAEATRERISETQNCSDGDRTDTPPEGAQTVRLLL